MRNVNVQVKRHVRAMCDLQVTWEKNLHSSGTVARRMYRERSEKDRAWWVTDVLMSSVSELLHKHTQPRLPRIDSILQTTSPLQNREIYFFLVYRIMKLTRRRCCKIHNVSRRALQTWALPKSHTSTSYDTCTWLHSLSSNKSIFICTWDEWRPPP